MGVNRGYRIDIGNMMKQLYPKDWGLVNGATWSLNQMIVTKRKETEETRSSFYNQYDPSQASSCYTTSFQTKQLTEAYLIYITPMQWPSTEIFIPTQIYPF